MSAKQPKEDKGGDETFEGWITNLSQWESKQWKLEAETHGEQATTLCNKTKSSQTCQTKHEFYHLTIHSEDSLNTENLDTLLFYTEKL